MVMESQHDDRWLVYDGDCPFCSHYVAKLRLDRAEGPIRLINARGGGPEVSAVREAGFDLNQGFVVRLNGRLYGGADAIHRLALVSTPSDTFNRMNAAIFRSTTAARWLYPVLRSGRALALRLLGRKPIESS